MNCYKNKSRFVLLLISSLIILISFVQKSNSTETRRPVVAIYSNNFPSDDKDPKQSQVLYTYVRWLISSGSDVAVIHPWDSKEYITYVLSEVDGVLYQGGAVDISNQDYLFVSTAKFITTSIIELTDKHLKSIAIWGTCLGFELISNVIEGKDILDNGFEAEKLVSGTFDKSNVKKSKMYKYFNDNEINYMKDYKVFNEHHHQGVTMETFKKSQFLNKLFKVTMTTKDENGVEYINSFEALNYSILATQHHPEKTVYDFIQGENAAASIQSVLVSRALGNAFVELSRESMKDFKEYSKTGKTNVLFHLKNFWKLNERVLENYQLRYIKLESMLPTLTDDGRAYYIYNKSDANDILSGGVELIEVLKSVKKFLN